MFICSIYNSSHLIISSSQSTPPLALQTVLLWYNLHAIKSKPCKCAGQGMFKVKFYSCATITITNLEHLCFPRKFSCAQKPVSPQEEIICHHRFVLLVLELHINEIIIEYFFILFYILALSFQLYFFALLFKSLL